MVLISVDFPSPVWPVLPNKNLYASFTKFHGGAEERFNASAVIKQHYKIRKLTNDDDVKLEAALEELFLDLTGDGVKANVRRCSDLLCGWLRHIY